MRAPLAGVCLSFSLLGAVACGGFAPNAPDTPTVRERAYRANNRGVARLERFQYPEAATAFREALQIDGSLAIARVNLSLALLYAQDFAGAAREAGEAARQLPEAPQPHYILGLIARSENRSADALQEFARVHQIDARDVGTNVNLGQMYLEQRQYPQAIEVLETAAAAEPFNVSAAYNLGLALTRSGRTADGQRALDRAQALRSTGYAVTFGNGYLEQGRYAEALASTGAETELVDAAVPSAAFSMRSVAAVGPGAAVPAPFGMRFAAADLNADGSRRIAAGLGGGLALFDLDGDDDLDLFVAGPDGQQLFRNDGRGGWSDVTVASGFSRIASDSSVAIGAVAGDYDNDGRPDLFVLRYGRSALYRNDGNGHLTDTTVAAQLPAYPFLPGAAAWVDVDHDGDLDLVIAGLADLAAAAAAARDRQLTFPGDFPPAPLRLYRNNGNGTFADITRAAGLDRAMHAVAIVPADFDNRRDVDLLIADRRGPPALFQNMRDGTFRDVAADTGVVAALGANSDVSTVAVADVNKDDFQDFLFVRDGESVLVASDGRGRFVARATPAGSRAALAAQFVDYDGDGLLDLFTWAADGPHVLRNLGRTAVASGFSRTSEWQDVSKSALPASGVAREQLTSARGLGLADLTGDGRTDLVTAGATAITFWSNVAGANTVTRSLRLGLKGRVSNRLGVGAKVHVNAGSLSARFETSAATPPVAPADVVFGLGRRPGADAVVVLWPSGILQAETPAETGSAPSDAPAVLASPLAVEELDRKPSSCPFLFTWNGERFEFITDFMGGGEMGYWESPGVWNKPDPLEYVRIPGDRLKPRDGRFEIRVTNELEEALFADRFQLLAVAHPREIDVYPNEGMTDPPKPFRLFAVADPGVPQTTDDQGRDVTDRIARVDRRYPDEFPLERIRGFAKPHTLTIDVGANRRAPVLLLTAWTDYAFSSDNVAAHQAGLPTMLPALQVRDTAGRWRTAVPDIGIPVGRPQTVPVDLQPLLRPGEHVVRIETTLRIYWDQILVASSVADARVTQTAIDPVVATLRERGFSAEVKPDGREPLTYDYSRVSPTSPWKTIAGRYTRVGDVRALLLKAEDHFVIAKPGDEISLSFDAGGLPPLPDGWTRTFLLLADGFSKEMDINSASPDRLEPLPFHAMTRYPYRAPERYPDDEAHRAYQDTFNTRVVIRNVPSLRSVDSR